MRRRGMRRLICVDTLRRSHNDGFHVERLKWLYSNTVMSIGGSIHGVDITYYKYSVLSVGNSNTVMSIGGSIHGVNITYYKYSVLSVGNEMETSMK